MASTDLRIDINAKDNASRVIKNLESSIIRFVGSVTSAIAAIGTAAFPILQAATFERALKDVQKTTGFTDDEIKILSDSILQLGSEMSVTAQELAQIAATGGQLGLGVEGVEAIERFTESVARANVTLGLTADQAAETAAQLLNIFKIPASDTERIFSVLNELSNTSVATADALGDIARRVADVAGLSFQQASALAAFSRDLGVTQEVAGTSLSTIFTNMESEAEKFSEAMGISQQEWISLLQNDAVEALKAVSTQLYKMDAVSRASSIKTLFGSGRIGAFGNKIVQDAANGFEILNQHIESANRAYAEGDSSIREYDKVMEALTEKVKQLINEFRSIAIEIGTEFIPKLKEYVANVRSFIQAAEFRNAMRLLGQDLAFVVDQIGKVTAAMAEMDVNWGNLIRLAELFIGYKLAKVIAGWALGLVGLGTAAASAAKKVGGAAGILAIAFSGFGVIPAVFGAIITSMDKFALRAGETARSIYPVTTVLGSLKAVVLAIPLAIGIMVKRFIAGAGATAIFAGGIASLSKGLKGLLLLFGRTGPLGIITLGIYFFHRQLGELLGLIDKEEAKIRAAAIDRQNVLLKRAREVEQVINSANAKLRSGAFDVEPIKLRDFVDVSFDQSDANEVAKGLNEYLAAGFRQIKTFTALGEAKEAIRQTLFDQEDSVSVDQLFNVGNSISDAEENIRKLSGELIEVENRIKEIQGLDSYSQSLLEGSFIRDGITDLLQKRENLIASIETEAEKANERNKIYEDMIELEGQRQALFEEYSRKQELTAGSQFATITVEGANAIQDVLDAAEANKKLLEITQKRADAEKELEKQNKKARNNSTEATRAARVRLQDLQAQEAAAKGVLETSNIAFLESSKNVNESTRQIVNWAAEMTKQGDAGINKVQRLMDKIKDQEATEALKNDAFILRQAGKEIAKWTLEAEEATRGIEAFKRKTESVTGAAKSLKGIFDNIFKTVQASYEKAFDLTDELENLNVDARIDEQLDDQKFRVSLEFDVKADKVREAFDKIRKKEGLDEDDPKDRKRLQYLEKQEKIQLRQLELEQKSINARDEYNATLNKARDRKKDILEEIKLIEKLEVKAKELNKQENPDAKEVSDVQQEYVARLNIIKDYQDEIGNLGKKLGELGTQRGKFGRAIDPAQLKRDVEGLKEYIRTYDRGTKVGAKFRGATDEINKSLEELTFKVEKNPEIEKMQNELQNANNQLSDIVKTFPSLAAFAKNFAEQIKYTATSVEELKGALAGIEIGGEVNFTTEAADTLITQMEQALATSLRSGKHTEAEKVMTELVANSLSSKTSLDSISDAIVTSLTAAAEKSKNAVTSTFQSLLNAESELFKKANIEFPINLNVDDDQIEASLNDQEPYEVKLRGTLVGPLEFEGAIGLTPSTAKARGGYIDTAKINKYARGGYVGIAPLQRMGPSGGYTSATSSVVNNVSRVTSTQSAVAKYADSMDRYIREMRLHKDMKDSSVYLSAMAYHTNELRSSKDKATAEEHVAAIERVTSELRSLHNISRLQESDAYTQTQAAMSLTAMSSSVNSVREMWNEANSTKDTATSAEMVSKQAIQHLDALSTYIRDVRSDKGYEQVSTLLSAVEYHANELRNASSYATAVEHTDALQRMINDIGLIRNSNKVIDLSSSAAQEVVDFFETVDRSTRGVKESWSNTASDAESSVNRSSTSEESVAHSLDTIIKQATELRGIEEMKASSVYLSAMAHYARSFDGASDASVVRDHFSEMEMIIRRLRERQDVMKSEGVDSSVIKRTADMVDSIERSLSSARFSWYLGDNEKVSSSGTERQTKMERYAEAMESFVSELRATGGYKNHDIYLESLTEHANLMARTSNLEKAEHYAGVIEDSLKHLKLRNVFDESQHSERRRDILFAIERNLNSARTAWGIHDKSVDTSTSNGRFSLISAVARQQNSSVVRDSSHWLDAQSRYADFVIDSAIYRARGGRVYEDDEEERRRRRRRSSSSEYMLDNAIHRARGGKIRGKGTGTSDEILAWLSNGEYVMDAWTTRFFGSGFFQELQTFARSGRKMKINLPGFAYGGSIGEPVPALLSNTSMVESLVSPDSMHVKEMIELILKDERGNMLGRMWGDDNIVDTLADALKAVKRRV